MELVHLAVNNQAWRMTCGPSMLRDMAEKKELTIFPVPTFMLPSSISAASAAALTAFFTGIDAPRYSTIQLPTHDAMCAFV